MCNFCTLFLGGVRDPRRREEEGVLEGEKDFSKLEYQGNMVCS